MLRFLQRLRKSAFRIIFWSVTIVVVAPHAIALIAMRSMEADDGPGAAWHREEKAFVERFGREAAEKAAPRDLRLAVPAAGVSGASGGIAFTSQGSWSPAVIIGLGEEERLTSTTGSLRYDAPDEFNLTGATINRAADRTVVVAGGYAFGPETGLAKENYLFWDLLSERALKASVPMISARAHHAAFALNGIEVLLIGGESQGCPIAAVERLDLATSKPRAAAGMADARARFASALLPDGRILVAGGNGTGCLSGPPLASAELYDPQADAWNTVPPMQVPRRNAKALTLSDGRVMVAGGSRSEDPWGQPLPLDAVEILDPAASGWRPARPMLFPRVDPVLALLEDGRVIAAGGGARFAELWDPATDRWQVLGSQDPDGVVGVALKPSGLLAVSRYRFSTDGERCVEPHIARRNYVERVCRFGPRVLDFSKEIPAFTSFLSLGRRGHVSVELNGGRILVTGGVSVTGFNIPRGPNVMPQDVLSIVELYDPATGRTRIAGQLASRRFGHQAFALPDGRVALLGGYTAKWEKGVDEPQRIPVASLEIFDPASGDSKISRAWGSEDPGHGIAAQAADGDLLIAFPALREGKPARLYRWSWRDDVLKLLGELPGVLAPHSLALAQGSLLILSNDESSGPHVHSWNVREARLRELPAPPRGFETATAMSDPARGYLGLLSKDGKLAVLDVLARHWTDRTDFLKSFDDSTEPLPGLVIADMGKGRLLVRNVRPKNSALHQVKGNEPGYLDVFGGDATPWPAFHIPSGSFDTALALSGDKLALVGLDYRAGIDYPSTINPGRVLSGSRILVMPSPPEGLSPARSLRRLRAWWDLR